MPRLIKNFLFKTEALNINDFIVDPEGWFAEHAGNSREAWFLAHTDDGVIWGRLQDGLLVTSSLLFREFQVSPPLRAVTLQQARLFNESEEIRVWRREDSFQACRLFDEYNGNYDSFDEGHVLWGTRAEARENGFTLLTDGRQGLRHAVPLDVPASSFDKEPSLYRPLRLYIRHYLSCDDDGRARVYSSRLLDLRIIHKDGDPKR